MSSGRIGYKAYAESTGGKTFDGRDMPSWEKLPPRVKDAWQAAAAAIVIAYEECPSTLPAPDGYPT